MKLVKLIALFGTLVAAIEMSTAQNKVLNKKLADTIDSLKKADQAPASMPNSKQAEAAFNRVIRSNFPLFLSLDKPYDG